MKRSITQVLTSNWRQKILALVGAIVVWLFVNQSIIQTKTLVGVPIRIVNLPATKTVEGLLPNGFLSRRVTLTLTGSKKLIDSIEPGDIEVILDASNAPTDWLVQIGKKNLHSLNPKIDLLNGVTKVSHQEFMIRLSRLVTAQIPIKIEQPKGSLPRSFMYLGVWPLKLVQTVSGPDEQVDKLKIEGIDIQFNLDDISKAELYELTNPKKGTYSKDVVFFKVPNSWKKVYIPFLNHSWQQINDPNADQLWIEILRKKLIPLEKKIPIRVFYPIETSETINPTTYHLATDGIIKEVDGITYLDLPLYAYEVSLLFIDIVRNNMEISIIAQPENDEKQIKWSVEFLEPQILEDRYVAFLNHQYRNNTTDGRSASKNLEEIWRNRFRSFMQNMKLYKTKNQQLDLKIFYQDDKMIVQEPI